jgi:hypothetical protein
MPSVQSQISPTPTESAVAETVRRVNAQALALLTRRVEINQRIRSLHRVVHGLRDLANHTASDPCDAASTTPKRLGTPGSEQRPVKNETCDAKLLRGYAVGRMRSRSSRQSKHELAVLSRACRIALMEAGNATSLDEIRARIERRGSFTFFDHGCANLAITRTLNAMRDSGEIRFVPSASQALWQRIPPPGEIDNSQ